MSLATYPESKQHAVRLRGQFRPIIALLLIFLFPLPHTTAQEKARLAPVEQWSTVFGARKVTLRFRTTDPDIEATRAGWVLALDRRTLASGEVPLITRPGQLAEVAVPISTPPVKPGAVLQLTLTVTLQGANNAPIATATKTLWVYPEDAFADRGEWLKRLKLRLYDPAGNTARRLDAAGVPYTVAAIPEALAEGEDGVAIVGEGVSFAEHRGIFGAMVKAAAMGRPVLCLAPGSGSFPLPGSEGSDEPVTGQVSLRRADIVRELDKRLDAFAWPGAASVASSLHIGAERDLVVANVHGNGEGWSWLECRYPDTGSALIVCGLGIVRHWDDTPAPRYLFGRLLSYLDDIRASGTKKPLEPTN